MTEQVDRRPIRVRTTWWAKSMASSLAASGVKPNQVSLASVAFATAGGVMLAANSYLLPAEASAFSRAALLIGAAVCIQLRLLCNLIDGMIAVEGNMQSKVGGLYNELPDRVADTIFLVAAGYAADAGRLGIELGWAASVLAVSTAYIRVFGAAQGLGHDFSGPMAKQHRMAVLTVACILAAAEVFVGWKTHIMLVALCVIVLGALFTCIRRTWRLANALEKGQE